MKAPDEGVPTLNTTAFFMVIVHYFFISLRSYIIAAT